MFYTLTMNPAVDYTVTLEQFGLGALNRTVGESLTAGGKGLNVSTVLHRLGEETVALGFLAGFTGDMILSDMRQRGVSSDFVILPQGATRINVKMRMGVETEINGAGPAVDQASLQTLYRKLDKLTEEDTLILSGSIPAGVPEDVYQRIMDKLGTRQGVTFVVDAEGGLLEETLVMHPFLMKPNVQELGVVCRRKLESWDFETIAACARELQRKGARNVLVSMGGDGALLVTEEGQVYTQEAPQGKLVDTIGAGDAMVAGFLTGYRRTKDFTQALKLAVAAGSATAFTEGLAEKEAIQALYQTL